jgi:hypothetical protein
MRATRSAGIEEVLLRLLETQEEQNRSLREHSQSAGTGIRYLDL